MRTLELADYRRAADMTTRDETSPASPEFDRLIAAWLESEARVPEPLDLVERTIAQRRRTRPRPAWLLPERWFPMQFTMQRVRYPRAAPYAVMLMVLVLIALIAVVAVGSRHRVPQPFGLAANGRLVIVTSTGDIATVDPVTGASTTIVGGPEADRYPVYSRDGTRIAFVRSESDGDAVFAVDEDGGNLVRLTHEPPAAPGATSLLAWSPDGSRLAFYSAGKLWIARTDGSKAHALDLGVPIADEIHWRPPAGDEILVRGKRDGLAGLLLVKADGSGSRSLSAFDGAAYDYLWHTWSPDGRQLAFSSKEARETHILTVDGADNVIRPVGGQDIGFPRFSPDGDRLALMVWEPNGLVRVGIVRADDPTPAITLTGPTFSTGIQFDWSPDGVTILAAGWGSEEPWILDPAGGDGTRATWSAAFPDWVEWQRLARD
jgi:dipeptidyl aminopeptidase/acylaminoacyl peptidase